MKHEIDVPDLPEGWRAVAYRRPIMNVDYILLNGDVMLCDFNGVVEYLIIEKIKPRRIVLEETEEPTKWGIEQLIHLDGTTFTVNSHKIWRVLHEDWCQFEA